MTLIEYYDILFLVKQCAVMVGRRGKHAKEDLCKSVHRQVDGVMADRHVSRKLKGNVLGACVTLAWTGNKNGI